MESYSLGQRAFAGFAYEFLATPRRIARPHKSTVTTSDPGGVAAAT